jgi:hypothetical protein
VGRLLHEKSRHQLKYNSKFDEKTLYISFIKVANLHMTIIDVKDLVTTMDGKVIS